MAREYIEIGCSPYDEPCAQVGDPDYYSRAMYECKAYMMQLRRMFGNEPQGAQLRIKAQEHDFGTYHEVYCYYDSNNEEAMEYAFKCESEGPALWDKESKRYLEFCKLGKEGLYFAGGRLPNE